MKNSFLKITGYVSLGLAIWITIMLFETDEIIGAIPFYINAYAVHRFFKGKIKNREGMIAYCVIMTILNLFLVSWIDVIFWVVFTFAWAEKD